ncbi:Putative divalent metal ion transporter [Elusimicrobium minutum Pei191]|uniref:Putative divalent metal ion transporter n=1 Tax=Elusimicrobium minutum (strain Pei191) TaxID=445932 RepID=B2KAP1_ELUMP|nr:magnesium transporter CorA family protein [Elusimicrobium minutum]ACC97587.1 Putative divalent metal ion transporter [Elusimicrobium minutum Pei191]
MRKYEIEYGKIVETFSDSAPILLFSNPTADEQRFLIQKLNIDEHTLASALDPEELPRLEFEPDHAAIIFKRPKNYSGKDQLEFKVASMGLFVYEERLVIVISEDIPLFIGKRFLNVTGLHDIFLKLIYNSISHYVEHLRVINMISEEIEDKMSESLDNKYLLNLFSLEKSLVYYANAISSNGFVFEKLRNLSSRIGLEENSREMLDDIIVENAQCQRQAEINSNVLASLIGARANIVSNNLNVLIKHLNAVTIWLMMPTFVVSAFSMNVRIPMAEHPNAFWMIMGLAVISVWLIITYWKHRNW